MLRSLKFKVLKNMRLNNLFCYYSTNNIDNNFYIEKENYIKDKIIKSNEHFELIKEEFLETYYMSFTDIIVIHLKERFLNDFIFLYKNSNQYLFDIYTTSSPDLKTEKTHKIFHIFCTSKNLSQMTNYMSFLIANDSYYKYTCLHLFYGSCIIINKRFDNIYKEDARYKYVKTIGKADVNIELKQSLELYINLVNNLQDTLPPHYLKIS